MGLKNQKIKGLGLCSGGLDSILSARVLQYQGIYVEWINFETPFFSSEKARKAAQMTGVPLTVAPITDIYLEMLKNPNCGYGRRMNPCMDCHALMFRLAGDQMKEKGFDFLFSGEVLGQRPMSQTKSSLRYVEKHSGYDGYIIRPLSATALAETIPEKNGLVDRERLLGLSGRSRKPQMELAEKYNITEYPTPGGGCLLTEEVYSRRLKDLFDHNAVLAENALHLLKFGRHLRLDKKTKLIIGRTHGDNESILKYIDPERDTILKVKGYPGPTAVIPGGGEKDQIQTAAAVCVSYSKAPNTRPVDIMAGSSGGRTIISAQAMPKVSIASLII